MRCAMKKIIASCLAIIMVMSVLSSCTKRELGTTAGVAIGGVAGNALTGGSALGTVAGAVGGGLIGNAVSH